MEELHGSIERVTYHSDETGYCVLRLKAKGHRDLVTLVGNLASANAGEFVEARGAWTQHKEFGVQFKADNIRTIHPTTLEGIERYLGSGLIKGIGPEFARRLVKEFGQEVFDTIEHNPKALSKVPGLGRTRIGKITEAWKEQKVVRNIMIFLQSHGVSTSKAVRIYKTYGENAVERVKENPYQLARDVYGIGFKSADQIASRLGVDRNSTLRARAGLSYALQEKVAQGHCAYPTEALLEDATRLLEIDTSILRPALETEILEGHLIEESIENTPCLFLSYLLRQEEEVAKRLHTLLRDPLPWPAIEAEKAVSWAETQLKLQLAPLQKEAVAQALQSKVLVITGGPGTGKTTLTRAILTILKAKKVRVGLCSPTGRAAKRLSEVTGLEAKTIHRLLGMNPKGGYVHQSDNLLELDLLLVDEASMVDLPLFYALLRALPREAALLLVGDVDQIPSVGPGAVLKSLIASEVLPVVRLTQIFRQAAESSIIVNAHKINHGEFPDLSPQPKESDFHYVEIDESDAAVAKLVEFVRVRIPRHLGVDPVRDIQVLCPMNRGALGTQRLNTELQKTLNPNPETRVERFGAVFSTGDKVMVTVNDYDKEVFNGDIGFVYSIDLEEQEVVVDFDSREVTFTFGELDILTLAYATTVHKAQGSEYPVVVFPVALQHFVMLKRNLLYTGVTRGKKMVLLLGQKKAIAIALGARDQGVRWNHLAFRLRSL